MRLLFEPTWEAPTAQMCCGCGNQWQSLRSLRALQPELKACGRCLLSAGKKALNVAEGDKEATLAAGRRAMRLAANIALSMAEPPKMAEKFGKCSHCGNDVIPELDGAAKLWCSACEADRKQYGTPPQPPLELVN